MHYQIPHENDEQSENVTFGTIAGGNNDPHRIYQLGDTGSMDRM